MRVQIVFGVLCACVLAAIDSSTSNSDVTQFLQVKANDGCAVCGMSPPNRTLTNIQHRVHCVSSCNHGCPSRCQAVNYWKTAKLCQLFYYEPCSYDTQDDCVIYRVTIAGFNVEQLTLFFSRLLNTDADLLASFKLISHPISISTN